MPWRVQYSETQDIVEVVYWGETSASDVRDAAVEAITLAKEHEATFGLVDCLEQTRTGSVLDLYELPALYDHEGLSRTIRMALVEPRDPKVRDLAMFYETVCKNRGWQIQTFPTREVALDWLLSVAQ